MVNGSRLGGWGEERAADFLRQRGYAVTAMNYRTRFGEIDIIAEGGGFLVFVEVKLRRNGRFAAPREFVTARKRDRVRTAASQWLVEHETELQPRFDVIEVYAPYGAEGRCTINHIENAFE